jgi:hypothetical protein
MFGKHRSTPTRKRRHNAPTSKLLELGGLWNSNTRISYVHDDRLLTLALACYASKEEEPQTYSISTLKTQICLTTKVGCLE